MSGDRLSFRREGAGAAPKGSGQVASGQGAPSGVGRLVALLLVLAVGLALLRPFLAPSPEQAATGVVIEVRGEVERPGHHLVQPPTVERALAAAGGPVLQDDRLLAPGARLVVEGGQVSLEPPSDPVLVGLPIDLNEATAAELDAIPSVSLSLAERIVADRTQRGPFRSVAELERVEGVGPSTVALLEPFVAVGEVPPTDLNTASAAELERLPGVGPVLAARIVVERADGGPFRSLEDLQRVEGIGPQLVERLRGRAVAQP